MHHWFHQEYEINLVVLWYCRYQTNQCTVVIKSTSKEPLAPKEFGAKMELLQNPAAPVTESVEVVSDMKPINKEQQQVETQALDVTSTLCSTGISTSSVSVADQVAAEALYEQTTVAVEV